MKDGEESRGKVVRLAALEDSSSGESCTTPVKFHENLSGAKGKGQETAAPVQPAALKATEAEEYTEHKLHEQVKENGQKLMDVIIMAT